MNKFNLVEELEKIKPLEEIEEFRIKYELKKRANKNVAEIDSKHRIDFLCTLLLLY